MVEPTIPDDMDHVAGPRDLVIEKVTSADGTSIAYERSGDGPATVVMLGGGLTQKAMYTPLAAHLAEHFTVFNYDRRGRGDSGDGDAESYTIDHEVEDLAAVVEAAGSPCHVWANCTGGIIAVRAAALGVPMTKLAVYEPPYESPRTPDDYLDRVKRLVAEERYPDAVRLFWREYVRFPEELIDSFSNHPSWDTFVALAPTIVYDGVIGNDHASIPADLLPDIEVPTLVIDGAESPPWQREACETLAKGIAGARHARLEGQTHLFNQDVLASVLGEFFAE